MFAMSESRVNKPLVSVVIPNFNYGRFLEEALKSVSLQTYTNWEVIVVDNFSSDDSKNVCESFSAIHNLTFLEIDNRGVVAISRNLGVKASSGDLVAFLDSDDTWQPRKLELAVQAYLEGADLSYHPMQINGKKSTTDSWTLSSMRNGTGSMISNLLVRGNRIANSSVVVKKSLIHQVGYLDESSAMAGAEDYNLWLRISMVTNQFHRIPEALGSYRKHLDSFSSQRAKAISRYTEAVEAFLSESAIKNSIPAAVLNLTEARLRILSGKPAGALAQLFQAIRFGNLEIKLRSLFLLSTNFLVLTKK